jgi:hypothetical protein
MITTPDDFLAEASEQEGFNKRFLVQVATAKQYAVIFKIEKYESAEHTSKLPIIMKYMVVLDPTGKFEDKSNYTAVTKIGDMPDDLHGAIFTWIFRYNMWMNAKASWKALTFNQTEPLHFTSVVYGE